MCHWRSVAPDGLPSISALYLRGYGVHSGNVTSYLFWEPGGGPRPGIIISPVVSADVFSRIRLPPTLEQYIGMLVLAKADHSDQGASAFVCDHSRSEHVTADPLTTPEHLFHLANAMSSILNRSFTVSLANSIALVLTSSGCSTFSSRMSLLTPPVLTLTPAFFSPCPCLCRRSVTTRIGLSPAFSASVVGTTSSASANALQHIASVPLKLLAAIVS